LAGTIVYVDTEPDVPDGLGRELARLGFRLEHTADPDAALALVCDGTARLLLIEPLIGDGEGFDLVGRIRRLGPPRGDVPVVVLTRGERTPELYAQAVELGADDYLARPVMRSEVLAAILECIESRDAGAPVDVTASGPGPDAASGAEGSLSDVPLAEILLHLRAEAATGVLFLQDFEGLVVQLRNGSPIAVASSRGNETFADFLMRTKRISGNEHQALIDRSRRTGESEPEAAVSIGALSPADVQVALVDCAAEPLLEAFAWTTGSFRFERGQRIRSGRALEGGTAAVLAQGVLHWMPSRPVRSMLDRRGALYLSRVDRPPCLIEDLSPPPCEPGVLERWAGDQTVAQVLESGVIGERELCALLLAGLAEAREEALLELDRVVETAPGSDEEALPILELDQPCDPVHAEPSDAPAASSAPHPEAAPSAPPPAGAVAPGPVAPSLAEPPIVEAPGEPTGEAAADPPVGEAAVGTPAEPTAEPPAEPSEAERAREAERHFGEGEKHLAAKRHARAVESFGMAAHLDPSQAIYHAHLGYALHLQSPDDQLVRREALEHIAKGVKLAAEEWKPLLFLARVFIHAGEHANARKVLVTGVHRHPDCEPLRAELRRFRQRTAEQEAGLVGRLRRFWGK
jgi:CheY-like chemotaxis protein